MKRAVPLEYTTKKESPASPKIAIPELLLGPGMLQHPKVSAKDEANATDKIPEIQVYPDRFELDVPPWLDRVLLNLDDEKYRSDSETSSSN